MSGAGSNSAGGSASGTLDGGDSLTSGGTEPGSSDTSTTVASEALPSDTSGAATGASSADTSTTVASEASSSDDSSGATSIDYALEFQGAGVGDSLSASLTDKFTVEASLDDADGNRIVEASA